MRLMREGEGSAPLLFRAHFQAEWAFASSFAPLTMEFSVECNRAILSGLTELSGLKSLRRLILKQWAAA
jgi:hypothetical protein